MDRKNTVLFMLLKKKNYKYMLPQFRLSEELQVHASKKRRIASTCCRSLAIAQQMLTPFKTAVPSCTENIGFSLFLLSTQYFKASTNSSHIRVVQIQIIIDTGMCWQTNFQLQLLFYIQRKTVTLYTQENNSTNT